MQRGKRFIPDITADFIRQASHLLIAEQPGMISAKILDFLAEEVTGTAFDELPGAVQQPSYVQSGGVSQTRGFINPLFHSDIR